MEAKGTLKSGFTRYKITSGGDNSCSIEIDGTEYAQGDSGLNIVVYDNTTRNVIDSVSFYKASHELSSWR